MGWWPLVLWLIAMLTVLGLIAWLATLLSAMREAVGIAREAAVVLANIADRALADEQAELERRRRET